MNIFSLQRIARSLYAFILCLTMPGLYAGDGSSATSPFVLTDDTIQDFKKSSFYELDGGLYYEISSAISIDTNSNLYLGTSALYNYLTLNGDFAFLSAGSFSLANEKGAYDWFTVTNGAAATFDKMRIACADSTSVVTIANGGSLTINHALQIGYLGKGFVNITGTSNLTTNDATVAIGNGWGSGYGSVTISGGGTMTNRSDENTVYLGCGDSIPSYVTVTGEGSSWYADAPVAVGAYGDGSELIVSNGAVAIIAKGISFGDGASIVLDHGYVAVKSTAALTPAEIEALHLYYVNGSALTQITANNYAQLKMFLQLEVTYFDGETNLFSDSGLYATLNAKGIDLNGYTLIHAGSLNVQTAPQNDENTLCVNDGTANVADAYKCEDDETWETVCIGFDTLNNFLIQSGGTFENAEADFGVESGSSASVTVTGASTVWTTTDTLNNGILGTARFCVYKGATVNAQNANIGKGGSGTCLVSDSGSLFSVGNLVMSATGSATLKVLNGALVKADTITNARGLILLDNGYLAIKSDALLDSSAIATFNLRYYDGTNFVRITAANLESLIANGQLKVTYYTADNFTSGDPLYDTYFTGKGTDLTGYTVIHGGLSDMDWADRTTSENGWIASSWYGWFYCATDYDHWIWSATNGWQYITSVDGGILVWDAASAHWYWTSEGVYPALYDLTDSGWFTYVEGTAPERKYWSWGEERLVTR